MNSKLESAVAFAREVGARSAGDFDALSEMQAARHALRLLGETRLLRWTVPAALGGGDTGGLCDPGLVSVRALCALRAELASHHGMLDVMFAMQGLGSYPLVLGATAECAAECSARLGAVARGEQIAAFALTEPEAGSNLAEIATRAERTAEGWRLNGHKTFISNAGLASFYTVLARTSGAPGQGSGLSMFLVPADAPGLRSENFEVIAPHPIGELRFENCLVPGSALLGAPGNGLELALGTLARFRTSVAAAANGIARRALAESIAHLKRRKQFGKPLAANQGLRFDIAEMDARLRAAELLVQEAATESDAGRPATLEVARAKLVATETAGFVCDRAVQHLGGLGVRRGQVVERLYREVRALRIYEGTSEIQKLILSKELLG